METSYLIPILVALSAIGLWLAFFVYAAREDLDNMYSKHDNGAAYDKPIKKTTRCEREQAERRKAQRKEWRKRAKAAEKVGNEVAALYWSRRGHGGECELPERLVFRSLLIKQEPNKLPRYFPATAIKTADGGYRAIKHQSYTRVKGMRVL